MKFGLKTEYIKYVKLFCNGMTIKSAVESISNDVISLRARYNAELLKMCSQNVTVNFICDDGLYRIKTLLIKVVKAEPYVLIKLKKPDEMEFQQKRDFFRISTSINCICETDIDGQISQYSGVIVNISANGVSAVFPNYFITDGKCFLKFRLSDKEFNLKSRYVRSESFNDSYRPSFNFVDISEGDKDFISKICLKKQLESRRKNLI